MVPEPETRLPRTKSGCGSTSERLTRSRCKPLFPVSALDRKTTTMATAARAAGPRNRRGTNPDPVRILPENGVPNWTNCWKPVRLRFTSRRRGKPRLGWDWDPSTSTPEATTTPTTPPTTTPTTTRRTPTTGRRRKWHQLPSHPDHHSVADRPDSNQLPPTTNL